MKNIKTLLLSSFILLASSSYALSPLNGKGDPNPDEEDKKKKEIVAKKKAKTTQKKQQQ